MSEGFSHKIGVEITVQVESGDGRFNNYRLKLDKSDMTAGEWAAWSTSQGKLITRRLLDALSEWFASDVAVAGDADRLATQKVLYPETRHRHGSSFAQDAAECEEDDYYD